MGSHLAISLKRKNPKWNIVALDNLKRAGSETKLPLLKKGEVNFLHGDVRIASDLPSDKFNTILDCAAEPSVLAGYTSNRDYPLQTNLQGTLNLLELALKNKSQIVLLSTSRVYSIPKLKELQFQISDTRYILNPEQKIPGCSSNGIAEDFPTDTYRSLYGTTKLASELFLEEYHQAFGLPTTVLRSGVIHGPGQLAKADQGIITFWLRKHLQKDPLQYIGFKGKQTRDAIDVRDLPHLIDQIIQNPQKWDNKRFNIGGGIKNSSSLLELTKICEEITGNKLKITHSEKERPMDIPFYITDHSRITEFCGWSPKIPFAKTLEDTYQHLLEKRAGI